MMRGGPGCPMDSVPTAAKRPPVGVLTALAGLVLLGFVAMMLGLSYGGARLEGMAAPERALALVVSRSLDLDEAVARTPAWERRLWGLVFNERAEDLAEGVAWYAELATISLDARVDLHLAVLEAEAGQLERLRRTLGEWRRRGEPFAVWADLVSVAYLGAAPDDQPAASAALAAVRAGDWFTDRLALRWATRAGDTWLTAAVAAELGARGRRVLDRMRWLVGSQAALLVVGGVALALLAWRRPARLGPSVLPPPWRGRDGISVLVRGGALAALLIAGVSLLAHGPAEGPWTRVALGTAVSLAPVPLVALARRRLLVPAGVGFRAGLGLAPVSGRSRALVSVTLALLAAGALGEVGLGLVARGLGIAAHWSEWFDPELAWGTTPILAAALADVVILTPVLEEIVFRGLLFATLRRRLPLAAAAPASAAVFALAHGYGLLGFLAVFWSGLLWAVAYEKTGSLLPSIAAHAVDNLGASLSVVLALRG